MTQRLQAKTDDLVSELLKLPNKKRVETIKKICNTLGIAISTRNKKTHTSNTELKNYPSEEVRKFGEDCTAFIYDANIRNSLGCRDFRIEDFPEEFKPYITAYLKDGLSFIAICYAAMKTREQELTAKQTPTVTLELKHAEMLLICIQGQIRNNDFSDIHGSRLASSNNALLNAIRTAKEVQTQC